MSAELERQWIESAAAGDEEAFAKLVEAYQMPVYNLAYRMLGNPLEAEDAAQETFIRAFTRFNTYKPGLKFSSWILSIASHHCIDRLRRRRGVVLSMEDIMGQRWIPDDHPYPEEMALKREERALIAETLEMLPTPYRLVIVLRYWHDASYEEIAEITKDSVSAIKSRLHRARDMIATHLQKREQSAQVERRLAENALSRSF
ncbi:MAG: sigma-70 family RNA polymerase sigma factor [Chloroflexi bacterium]|nr:sigma-70 family RNA polymerase sigma factor [Chloroflexota bacterium]